MCDRQREIRVEMMELTGGEAQSGVSRVRDGTCVVNLFIDSSTSVTNLITEVCVERRSFHLNQARPKYET